MEEVGLFTRVSPTWLFLHTAWLESSECLLIAAIQTTSEEHICQETEGAGGGGYSVSQTPEWMSTNALSWQAQVLRFSPSSDISKCPKNSYYLKGVLENASHFLSPSPQRIQNMICAMVARSYWSPTSSGLWHGKLRLSLGLSVSRRKVHPLIKGCYGYVSGISHTQSLLQKSGSAPFLQVRAK